LEELELVEDVRYVVAGVEVGLKGSEWRGREEEDKDARVPDAT
jgi:hypothetical protein